MSVKIEKEKAKKLYPEVPEWFKEELIKEFGEAAFKKRKFNEIKTFEDACEELGISTAQFFGTETSDEVAYKKLKVIIKAINEAWIPDWTNTNQMKWFPWFYLSSGFGFSRSYFNFDDSAASVGSRLCFETEEKSDYAARQFIDLYEEFLTLKH
jgi:hypothetical protein